jgi:hypothetical protein
MKGGQPAAILQMVSIQLFALRESLSFAFLFSKGEGE